MDQSNSKVMIIAIAVIAVVAIAGAAVFILNGNNGGGGDILEKTKLPIYGNANGDEVIDGKDIDLINDMIASSIPLSDYPFADADRDGKVTSNDVSIVKKIMAGEKTDVTFIDQYDLVAGKYRHVTVEYPLKDVVTQNADMLLLTMMIDADDQVAGYVANVANYPNEFYKVTHNGISKQVGSTARQIAAADWVGIKNLDVELQEKGSKIGAILVHSDQALGDYKDDIIAAGFPIIYLRCTDPIYSLDAAVLLGTLLGPDYSGKAVSFSKDCKSTLEEIDKKVSKVTDKKQFISLCMVCYIAQDESQYTKLGEQAGGKGVANLPGNTSVKLQDVEAITKYNDKIDYMLNCSTQDCTNVDPISLWEDPGCRYMNKSTHFEDMVWVNMSMPVSCRVMYVASLFYPNIISETEADSYFQNIVDNYMPYLHETVSDGYFDVKTDMFTLIDYQDYLDAKGGDEPVTSEVVPASIATHFYDRMDWTGFSGEPFKVEVTDNQLARVVPTNGGNYYLEARLYKDAAAKFAEIKAEYEAKIGTESAMGGTNQRVESPYALENSIGYYVNTTNENSIGSIHYAFYYKECVVEIKLAKKPSLSQNDIDMIVLAAWGVDGQKSALESAQSFDISLLENMRSAPYTIDAASDSMVATISSTDGKYYVIYDNNASAFLDFEVLKEKYIEKAQQEDYMGGKPKAIPLNGFEDGAGFWANTTKTELFGMIQFAGYIDGCYVQIYIRMDYSTLDDDSVNEIVSSVARSIVGVD